VRRAISASGRLFVAANDPRPNRNDLWSAIEVSDQKKIITDTGNGSLSILNDKFQPESCASDTRLVINNARLDLSVNPESTPWPATYNF
jgi:hypothetical protein